MTKTTYMEHKLIVEAVRLGWGKCESEPWYYDKMKDVLMYGNEVVYIKNVFFTPKTK